MQPDEWSVPKCAFITPRGTRNVKLTSTNMVTFLSAFSEKKKISIAVLISQLRK